MLNYPINFRHGEGNFQRTNAPESAGFGDALGLIRILRADHGNQTG
jgi:hypothetical protein